MIRLEGATLPPESQGAIPPILFGDLLRDVPGIPLQVGWAAVLADNCGIDASVTTLRLGGADLAETLAAVPATGVVQLEQEWISYSAILSGPPRLTIAARGYAGTTAAVHAKGTAVYFVETRPLYVLAYVPPGCTYPDDALVQLRVQDNAETPPATVRLQDDRLVPGVRLVTVEFDASHAFLMPPPPPLPSQAIVFRPFSPGASGAALTVRMGGGGAMHGMAVPGTGRSRPAAHDPRMRVLGPAPPTLRGDAAAPPAAPFAGQTGSRITLRQGALGTVTADLKGLRDTPAGRYSGVGLGPLVQPAAIVRLLLEETYGETDPAAYHAPTWTATAAAHAAAGITWRLVWQGEAFEAFREAAQLCGQADLSLDEEGRWRYQFRDPRAPAVGTLTARELLEEPGLAWTSGRDVITELEVAWGAGLQGGTVTLASPAMAVRHGRNHGGVAFAYAATEPIARRLGQYQLSRRDRPRQSVTVRACHATLGLTLADKIHLDTPLLALYAEARVPFEIIGLTDRGDQRVLVCLEADALALELFGAGVGTATLVGSLGEPDTLAGSVGATGMLAGSLTTEGAAALLVGAAAAAGTLEGTLVSAAALLAGSAAATGTLAGTLVSAAALLAGSAAATGTLAGTLVSAAALLAGTAAATGTLAGTLTTVAVTWAWDAAGATWDTAGETWDGPPPPSPPAVDAVTPTSGTGAVTVSHPCSGTNRLLLVAVSIEQDSGETITSVTYDGVALTLLAAPTYPGGISARCEVWYLVAPATGSHPVVITPSLATEWAGAVISFTGVNPSTPLRSAASVATLSTNATLTPSSAVSDLVFGVLGANGAPSVTDDQTNQWNQTAPGSGQTRNVGSTKAGAAATTTVSWTHASAQYAAVAVAIVPA